MVRELATVAVVCLVVLAGCGFGLGGDRPTDTATDTTSGSTATTATAGTEETTTTAGDGQSALPPGYTTEGLNASRALETHLRAVKNTSAFVLNTSFTSRGGAMEVVVTSRARGPGGEYTRLRVEQGETTSQVATWTAGTDAPTYYRQMIQREAVSRNVSGTVQGSPGNAPLLRFARRPSVLIASAVLSQFSYEYQGRVTRSDTRLHAYTAAAPADTGSEATITAFNLTLLVDDDGRIHRLQGTFTERADGTETTGRVDIRLALTTPTVSAPAWTTSVPVVSATFADSGAIAVHNDGPGAVRPGIILVRQLRNPALSFDGHIAEGETLYIYRTRIDDGLTTNVTTTPPAPEAVVDWQTGTDRRIERLSLRLGGNYTHRLTLTLENATMTEPSTVAPIAPPVDAPAEPVAGRTWRGPRR